MAFSLAADNWTVNVSVTVCVEFVSAAVSSWRKATVGGASSSLICPTPDTVAPPLSVALSALLRSNVNVSAFTFPSTPSSVVS